MMKSHSTPSKIRGWNIEITDRRSQLVYDIWLNLVDTQDTYTNERIELLNTINQLLPAVMEQDIGNIHKFQSEIETILKDAPSSLFDSIRTILKHVLINFESGRVENEMVMDIFWDNIEIDLEELRQESTELGVDLEAGQFKGRIGDIISNKANDIVSSNYDFNALRSGLIESRDILGSDQFVNRYRAALARIVEEFLRGESSATEYLLQEVLKRLFAELYVDDCREKGLEKIIKMFAGNNGDVDRTRKLSQALRGNGDEVTCYVLIPNVDMEDITPLRTGEVTFFHPSGDMCDIFDRLHKNADPFKGQIQTDADLIAKLSAQLPTASIGRRRIQTKLTRALDVLNFRKKRGLIGSPFEKSHIILHETKTDEVRCLFQSFPGEFASDFLSSDTPERVRSRIELFERHLTSNPSTPLDQAFTNSVQWYGYATRSSSDVERFLKYVIALESLLVKNIVESKSDTIAHRAIQILQVHEDYRERESSIFREMYDIRSQIVHQGVSTLPEFEYQLDRLRKRTQDVLSVVASCLNDCTTIDEVVERIHAEEDKLKTEKIAQAPVDVGTHFEINGTLIPSAGDEIGTVTVDAEFCDDGRYVYYEGELELNSNNTDVRVRRSEEYELYFELDGNDYIATDVTFPESTIFDLFSDPNLPLTVRWYDIIENE